MLKSNSTIIAATTIINYNRITFKVHFSEHAIAQ